MVYNLQSCSTLRQVDDDHLLDWLRMNTKLLEDIESGKVTTVVCVIVRGDKT